MADAEQVVHKRLDEQGLKLMAIINNAGIAGRGRQLSATPAELYTLSLFLSPT